MKTIEQSHIDKNIVIPDENLALACMPLQTCLPDLTPGLLRQILLENYDESKERVELVTVREAAKIIGVSELTIYRMIHAKKLTKYKVGNGRLYRINKYELYQS